MAFCATWNWAMPELPAPCTLPSPTFSFPSLLPETHTNLLASGPLHMCLPPSQSSFHWLLHHRLGSFDLLISVYKRHFLNLPSNHRAPSSPTLTTVSLFLIAPVPAAATAFILICNYRLVAFMCTLPLCSISN